MGRERGEHLQSGGGLIDAMSIVSALRLSDLRVALDLVLAAGPSRVVVLALGVAADHVAVDAEATGVVARLEVSADGVVRGLQSNSR